jgi:hypothetical protein
LSPFLPVPLPLHPPVVLQTWTELILLSSQARSKRTRPPAPAPRPHQWWASRLCRRSRTARSRSRLGCRQRGCPARRRRPPPARGLPWCRLTLRLWVRLLGVFGPGLEPLR